MPVTISSSVGADAPNRKKDVETIQDALVQLAKAWMDPRLHPGPVDGDCGVGTEGAIEYFQRRLGHRRPDARIDPAGNTLRRMNAWLAIGAMRPQFPFSKKPQSPYHGEGAGMRAFGARRRDGDRERAHAGVDLYFPDFTPVVSMAAGVALRDPYPFYGKTFAIEVDHGPVIARYCELAPESQLLVKKGQKVKRGQKLGRVGILKKDNGHRFPVPSMMLHLELYDKTATGKLTRKSDPARTEYGVTFKRRKDLVDPTSFLQRAKLS